MLTEEGEINAIQWPNEKTMKGQTMSYKTNTT
jgi:hypothetical protein